MSSPDTKADESAKKISKTIAEAKSESTSAKPSEEVILLDSLQQPAWHVVVLSLFTFGAYNMFWLYKSLRTLLQQSQYLAASCAPTEVAPGDFSVDAGDDEAEKKPTAEELVAIKNRLQNCGTLGVFLKFTQTRPIFTTFLFAVPILNLIVLLGFAFMSAQLHPDEKSFVRKNPQFSAFVVALLFGALTLLIKLPEPYQLMYLTSSLSLAAVQMWLNSHWKVYENNSRLARQAFSPLEILFIVLGAAWIGLVVVHTDLKI